MKTIPIRIDVETADAIWRTARQRDPDISRPDAVRTLLTERAAGEVAQAPPAPQTYRPCGKGPGGCWLDVAEAHPHATLGDADGVFGVYRLLGKGERPDRLHCALGCDGYRLLRRTA